MGEVTEISWSDHTFNAWWGCARVSPACNHCYAEAWAKRTGFDIWGKGSERRFFDDKHWAQPVAWDRKAAKDGIRRRVFCASMADVFEARPDLDDQRARLWGLIKVTPNLDWMLLTKRPENIAAMVPWGDKWPSNVWAGTTAENQAEADRRIPVLIQAAHSATVRFISAEPLLGPLRLDPLWLSPQANLCGTKPVTDESRRALADILRAAGRRLGWSGLDWVICGGESGAKARPMHPSWARNLRDQCQATGVAFHFKQWGVFAPDHGDQGNARSGYFGYNGEWSSPTARIWGSAHPPALMVGYGKKAAGRELDGRTWDQYPEPRT